MSLNWIEIKRVLEELPLEGCFLQNIRQVSYHHLIFELYSPGCMGEQQVKRATSPGRTIQLLICLDRKFLRIHETERRFKSLSKPPRFTSFMRSRIKGCRLEEVSQLGQERIIRMIFKKGDAGYKLYIRLWGGAANLFLCDSDGKILDAFSRRPARKEMPGEFFKPEEMEMKPSGRIFTLKEEILRDKESYNCSLDRYYCEAEDSTDILQLKAEAGRALDMLENQYLSGLTGLRKRLEEYEKEGELRRRGDLIMGALSSLKKGERFYRWSETEDPVPLDPRKSPVENAQDYYKRAGKASRGHTMTAEEISLLEQKLSAIEIKRTILEETDDPEKIRTLIPRNISPARGEKEQKTPGLSFSSGGFTLLAGRNASENDALLRNHVRGNDYWLHTRDYAGGYIFIRISRNKSVPLEVLLDAGNLAVFYSKAKKSGQADVYYTQVKYLRRPKEGKKGLVLPTKEKNLYIKLDEKRIGRLKDELA